MSFAEKIALEVKQRCHFQCCLCKALGVEIHHIIPQSEGGPDTIANAAPLCPSCHEIYGANPVKRKFIREVRDFWYEVCAKRYASDFAQLRDIRAMLEGAASKSDFVELRRELMNRSAAIDPNNLVESKSLSLADYLRHLHAREVKRPSFQIDFFCMRELWPTGKEDLRGLYKRFIQRFGELTLRSLVNDVLDDLGVAPAEHVREDDIESVLSRTYVCVILVNLIDSGHIAASLNANGVVVYEAIGDQPP
jgi:hypothetical protein